MSKMKLRRLLIKRLRLESPRYLLETDGNMIIGSVISPSFQGMDDYQRQRAIRSALREELSSESLRQVGMILAYTPQEWDFDGSQSEPANNNGRRRRKQTLTRA